VVLAGWGLSAGSATSLTDADARAAAASAVEGMALAQKAEVVTEPLGDEPPLARTRNSVNLQSSDMQKRVLARAHKEFAKHASGSYLQSLDNMSQAGLKARTDDPSTYSLGGGAELIAVDSWEPLDADRLRVKGQARVWDSMISTQGGEEHRYNPSGILDFTATMKNVPQAGWIASEFSWEFHPGSEP